MNHPIIGVPNFDPYPTVKKETIPWPRRQRDQREDRGAALSQQRSHDGAASVAVDRESPTKKDCNHGDSMGFNGDLMVIQWDLMVI